MANSDFKPFVPADSNLKELSVKALLLGVLMAVVLGAANAYLGMKAGLTVAATFPAAVVAMAALRIFKGNILEENIARTTASVGEALVAGAIFTIPAFVISGVWEELRYWESTLIMLIGGLLGVLFITILRRSMVEETDLPFPESVAAAEIVKAGQGGQTGAGAVFASMGIAGLWELFKNSNGIHLIADSTEKYFQLFKSKITMLTTDIAYGGGFLIGTPAASPALAGVGFIVGMRVASVLFSGAVMGWLVMVPLGIFLNPSLSTLAAESSWLEVANEVWYKQIRPFAVGTMIVAAFYTLYNLKDSLFAGITKAIKDLKAKKDDSKEVSRLEVDLDFKKVGLAIIGLAIPLFFLYNYFAQSIIGALLLTVVMIILGFLFSAVAGYLVGLVGSSNNPISGLTLSSLLISAILLVIIGVTGDHGVMAVLAVAGVVCTTAGIAGDMTQDLKVGHILGGTPWRMEIGEIIGVIAAALLLVFPMIAMDKVYHIGSAELPAPQAGLMALMSKGIVGGEMAWPLVIAGMFFAIGLILVKSPSPMLIAVGMYLPFASTAAIFVGGIIRWLLDVTLKRSKKSEDICIKAENKGVLISSGLIAGEALMAVILAFLYLGQEMYEIEYLLAGEKISMLKHFAVNILGVSNPSAIAGFFVFLGLAYLLIVVPLKSATKQSKN
ncbi:MAG: oligopeptide transporter, OPT family [Calditrichaceae bacterium]|nr:oligopeptide transporter, OPT family [Calditrichaceae bacterium]